MMPGNEDGSNSLTTILPIESLTEKYVYPGVIIEQSKGTFDLLINFKSFNSLTLYRLFITSQYSISDIQLRVVK